MNIRTAILKAADSIEQNPCSYNFIQGRKAIGPARNGCMLVWIGHFAGIEGDERIYSNNVAQALGLSHWNGFIDRIKTLGIVYYTDVEGAPEALRLYADKYHPESRFHKALIPADADFEWNSMAEV